MGGPATWQVRYLAANGDIIDLSDENRWLARERHGFGSPDFHEFTSRGVRQAGDTLAGLYANPRVLEVPFTMLPKADVMNGLRRRLEDAMNPDLGDGVVEYTDKQLGDVWTMTVRPQALHLDTAAKQANYHDDTLRWNGHDPLWYGPPQTLSIPVNSGAITLNYLGQMPAGYTLQIPAPLTTPILVQNTVGTTVYKTTLTTGSYLAGNTLQIVTIFNKKTTLLLPAGTDVSFNRGLGSIYWWLQRGQNSIQITTGNSAEKPTATLTYQVTRLGV